MTDIDYTEDIAQASVDEIVCYCSQVTKGDILAAKAAGARKLAEIKP